LVGFGSIPNELILSFWLSSSLIDRRIAYLNNTAFKEVAFIPYNGAVWQTAKTHFASILIG
jgi:hypothetical protein